MGVGVFIYPDGGPLSAASPTGRSPTLRGQGTIGSCQLVPSFLDSFFIQPATNSLPTRHLFIPPHQQGLSVSLRIPFPAGLSLHLVGCSVNPIPLVALRWGLRSPSWSSSRESSVSRRRRIFLQMIPTGREYVLNRRLLTSAIGC